MGQVSNRLQLRVRREFGDGEAAAEVIGLLAGASASERVHAAIILAADGNLEAVRYGAHLAEVDWRDVLMNGGMADEDWVTRLDAEFGSP